MALTHEATLSQSSSPGLCSSQAAKVIRAKPGYGTDGYRYMETTHSRPAHHRSQMAGLFKRENQLRVPEERSVNGSSIQQATLTVQDHWAPWGSGNIAASTQCPIAVDQYTNRALSSASPIAAE
ncbi:uncharacterized [Tachysurus ichikawai]